MGGRGTRLGELATATPKCLQPVDGRPFIDYLLWNLARHGICRVVFATGWLHDAVARHIGDGSTLGIEAIYSRENTRLGTGGAVALARSYLTDDEVLIANGDGLIDCNYLDLALLRRRTDTDVAVALTQVDDASGFGAVEVGSDQQIRAFREKQVSGPSLISAGTYIAATAWLHKLPSGPSSLETDVLPELAANGRLSGHTYTGFFAEIGTPRALAETQTSIPVWRDKPCVFLSYDEVFRRDINQLSNSKRLHFLRGISAAIKLFNDSGWLVVVIGADDGTDQYAYAPRSCTRASLAAAGAHVDAAYCSPYPSAKQHASRLTILQSNDQEEGVLGQAIREWTPDLKRSVLVSDKPSCLKQGAKVGLRSIVYRHSDLWALAVRLISGVDTRP